MSGLDCQKERGVISQGEKAIIIKGLLDKYRLSDLLKASGLSKSTYYFKIKRPDTDKLKNAQLMADIVFIFNDNKSRYGVRRITAELNKKYKVNHKKVQRLMHKLNLKGKRPKEKWTTDVSQFNFGWGKCYLSPILDMFNDEIVSYNLSLHQASIRLKICLIKPLTSIMIYQD